MLICINYSILCHFSDYPRPETPDICSIFSDENREKSNSSERKKVTFDLNVKVYEDLRSDEEDEEDTGNLEDNNDENKAQNKEGKCVEATFGSPSDSSSSSLFSFPPNHRYQNCWDSDDEVLSSDESDIDDDYEDEDEDEVESEVKNDQCQSSESLFSLSLNSRKQGFETGGDKEVNSPMPIKNSNPNDSNLEESNRNSSKYVDSVLNPVENLTQWKFIKARSKRAAKENQAKENMISGQKFSFVQMSNQRRKKSELIRAFLHGLWVQQEEHPRIIAEAAQYQWGIHHLTRKHFHPTNLRIDPFWEL